MAKITLQQAIEMTTLYRQNRDAIVAEKYQGQDVLALSETFEVDEIKSLISNQACVKFRIYYGMDASLKVHAILVGVNENDEDILPADVESLTDDDGEILEEAQRCPQQCPPSSPLNTP